MVIYAIAVVCTFPIAFLITCKDEGTYPAHASKLKVDDKKLYFNMTQGNLDYVAFPSHHLKRIK
jgi:hypothetical protein